MITLIDGVFNQTIPQGQVILMLAISIAVTLAFYVLRSIGLFVMAKRAKINHAFIAWIPFVWMYIAVKLIKKVNFFGKPMEKLAVIFCVIFSVASLLEFVYNALIYFPLIGNFFMGREISILMTGGTKEQIAELTKGLTRYWGMAEVYHGADFVSPYKDSIYGIINLLNVISYASLPLDLASIVITIAVYVNLFKRYLPQHYLLATIVSIVVGGFGPFVFAIRKREPMNYIDYLRSRYQSFGAYGPYGPNPYGQNPYGQNPYGNARPGQGAPNRPDTPFSEFAEKGEVDPGDPFKEFSNDKKDE
jgi:hypothetical protein